jgi:hypothetical protein
MKGSTIRCVRCKGRKKLYKVNGGYTYTNTGGVQMDCPMCLGKGITLSLEEAVKEATKMRNKKEKDFIDAKAKRE